MASGKRASMREGPLAQLFRKTEEDDARPAEPEPKPRSRAAEPEQARPDDRSPGSAGRCPRAGPRRRSRATSRSRRRTASPI